MRLDNEFNDSVDGVATKLCCSKCGTYTTDYIHVWGGIMCVEGMSTLYDHDFDEVEGNEL